MSSAVLEGLVAGCACLTSDITANAQLIDHGVTGLLFRNEDVLDLSSKLGTLLEDHALRRRLGEAAARAGAERYSIWEVARQYQTLYLQVLSE
jgi:glycosyltransferase involved in cell wall biosynthesis